MNILECVEEYYKIRNSDDKKEMKIKYKENRLRKLEKNIDLQIKETRNVELLCKVIELDKKEFTMPVYIMFHIYKKIVELEDNSKNILLDFAEYIFLHGPDWDEESSKMVEAIETNDIDLAKSICKKIDYK
ncbi:MULTISPECIES: hypothetical protein [Clostridium]|uniref:hypothetical protein n=1 Tax=Clostridium TaxID=1485 RepID=UPI000773963A|nr:MULTISPECIES: hypothetical protein [Clostridium]AUM95040.1 hypothetical protein RSJ11_07740 [Clostridium sporogenes]AVQ52479.1 hypothetical protein C7M59_06280 [Clostridium botulinum]